MAIEAKATILGKDKFDNIQVTFPIDNQIIETSCKVDATVNEIFFSYSSNLTFIMANGKPQLVKKYEIILTTDQVHILKVNFTKNAFRYPDEGTDRHLIFYQPFINLLKKLS